MGRNNLVGAWGEATAAEYLRKKRYEIVAAGYRCRFGEIDLVARDKKGTICFVEVKLRGEGAIGLPREFVDSRKQARLRTSAETYLSMHDMDVSARFDVAEVYTDQTGRILRMEYLENAFQ